MAVPRIGQKPTSSMNRHIVRIERIHVIRHVRQRERINGNRGNDRPRFISERGGRDGRAAFIDTISIFRGFFAHAFPLDDQGFGGQGWEREDQLHRCPYPTNRTRDFSERDGVNIVLKPMNLAIHEIPVPRCIEPA